MTGQDGVQFWKRYDIVRQLRHVRVQEQRHLDQEEPRLEIESAVGPV